MICYSYPKNLLFYIVYYLYGWQINIYIFFNSRLKITQLLVILDGAGDTIQPTPYERAIHPTFDSLTQRSGMFYSISANVAPGSDYAHLTMFGGRKHPRGVFETLGLDLEVHENETAYKCIFGYQENNIVINRKPKINDEQCVNLINQIMEFVKQQQFKLRVEMKSYEEHRFVTVIGKLTKFENDPKHDNMPFGSNLDDIEVNEIVIQINKFLETNEQANNYKTNCILLRGPSELVKFAFPLKTILASDAPVIRGIGKCFDMQTRWADWETLFQLFLQLNQQNKQKSDQQCKQKLCEIIQYTDQELIILHFERTDTYSHKGDINMKVKYIELIDWIVENLLTIIKFSQIIITSDHTTSCISKQHSIEPIPIAIWQDDCDIIERCQFNEKDCSNGELGIVMGGELLEVIVERKNNINQLLQNNDSKK